MNSKRIFIHIQPFLQPSIIKWEYISYHFVYAVRKGKMKTNESVPSVQKDVDYGFNEGTDQVILRTGPEKVSFAFKYLLACTPIILVFVCIIATIYPRYYDQCLLHSCGQRNQ